MEPLRLYNAAGLPVEAANYNIIYTAELVPEPCPIRIYPGKKYVQVRRKQYSVSDLCDFPLTNIRNH